ncbi:MAG: MFS transporter [Acetobacteraceae bacterium]|nr:MFS transporter [Acetobacteraceae bacterium]MSP30267.1 MFS transporter [Acetobacteraceae bacterium]
MRACLKTGSESALVKSSRACDESCHASAVLTAVAAGLLCGCSGVFHGHVSAGLSCHGGISGCRGGIGAADPGHLVCRAGVGQITQGTLADRFRRRAPLIAGFSLYTAGCIGCALAPDIHVLAGFCALSALGASAGAVIPRAAVRDLADGHAAVHLQAKLMLVMAAAPILAPSVGGLLLTFWSWRAVFWVFTAYGPICLALIVWELPENLPAEGRVRHVRAVRAHLVVFARVHPDRWLYSHAVRHCLGARAVGLIACSQLSPRLLPRFGAGAWCGSAPPARSRPVPVC